METVVVNVAGRVRRTELFGRPFLVAPLTMLRAGVFSGSRGPLYYPPGEIAASVMQWNHMPIVVYHPEAGGGHVSARHPEVLAKQYIGLVLGARVENGKLLADGYFDVEATRRVDSRVLLALERGQRLELSTGLFTENEPARNGATHNGVPYVATARRYVPDHLAILPDQKGACSLEDGCGVLANAAGPRGGAAASAGARRPPAGGGALTVNRLQGLASWPGDWAEVANANHDGCNQHTGPGCGTGAGKGGGKSAAGKAAKRGAGARAKKSAKAPGHPLEGLGDDEKRAVLASETRAAAASPNPRGYDTKDFPPGVDGAKLTGDVKKALDAAKSKSSFARPTVADLYDAVKATNPGLSLHDFQGSLVKLQADKVIRLTAYTQALSSASGRDLDAMIPLDREPKFYLDRGDNFVGNRLQALDSDFWSHPRSLNTGKFKRQGSGFGRGEQHAASQRGGMHLSLDDHARGADAAAQKEAGHNPPGWAVDEELWERAKAAADEGDYEGDEYWAVVAHIYQKMGGTIGGTENAWRPVADSWQPLLTVNAACAWSPVLNQPPPGTFDETKHDRAADGKFTSGGDANAGGAPEQQQPQGPPQPKEPTLKDKVVAKYKKTPEERAADKAAKERARIEKLDAKEKAKAIKERKEAMKGFEKMYQAIKPNKMYPNYRKFVHDILDSLTEDEKLGFGRAMVAKSKAPRLSGKAIKENRGNVEVLQKAMNDYSNAIHQSLAQSFGPNYHQKWNRPGSREWNFGAVVVPLISSVSYDPYMKALGAAMWGKAAVT